MPLPARGVPPSLALPSVPMHPSPLGRTGGPSAMIRTVADTSEPAFGFAGVILVAVAVVDLVPPPENSPTTTVTEAALFERTGSGVDVPTISAFTV